MNRAMQRTTGPAPQAGWAAAATAVLCAAVGNAGATTCVVLLSAMPFAGYDTILNSATDTTATVQVSCTPGATDPLTTAYVLTIAGTGSGSDSVRSVSSGAYRLYYQVYKDAGRTQVWGNGGSSGAGVSNSTTSTAHLVPGTRTHTAYARMPARQAVPPGVYTGGLLVTIDY